VKKNKNFTTKALNVFLILKIQDQKNMNSGKVAGISPYDCKLVVNHFFLSTTFCRSLECGGQGGSPRAARRRFLKRDVSR